LSVSPTPATDIINVDYDIQNTTQANLRLIKMDNSVDITEEIDINSSTKTININNCSLGIYSIILICDDVVKDHKTIIIQ
jgi:putative ubiquitin-RnfH superfamily antitoxin RatB of RatAB toxin-antitoxin module